MAAQQNIVVIGAGILGASVALRLSEAGANITVVNAPTTGGNASECSFGWVNASHGNPRNYFDLRVHAMGEWAELKQRFPEIPLHQNGTLYLHYDVDVETHLNEHLPWGYDLKAVGQETIAELEPALSKNYSSGVLAQEEARLEVAAAADCLLGRCNGVEFENARVLKLIGQGAQVTGVETDKGIIEADQVILAAGAGSPQIAQTVGVDIPIETPTGLLVRTTPVKPLIHHTLLLEGLHLQQLSDGSLLAGADFGGGAINDDPQSGAEELLRRIKASLLGTEEFSLAGYTQGRRPTPVDGFPVIGRPGTVSGLYVMVMHSGATLAAGVSKLAAEEILGGERSALLDDFGLNRFNQTA